LRDTRDGGSGSAAPPAARVIIPHKAAGSAPGGLWIDFTALAADYGFERLPALSSWRIYYPGTLFTQFALRAGLTWEEAMLQIYSAEDLAGILPTGSP